MHETVHATPETIDRGEVEGRPGDAQGVELARRARRLMCTNRTRPHLCAEDVVTVEVVAEPVDGVGVLACTRCGWPLASVGALVVVDDRDLEPHDRTLFHAACDRLGLCRQDDARRAGSADGARVRSDVRAGFDDRGREWERNRTAFTETFGYSKRLKSVVLDTVGELSQDGVVSLADFGCGTGGLLEACMAAAGSGTFAGIDGSAVMMHRAAARLSRRASAAAGVALDLVLGAAEATPLRNESFDIASAELLLHHVDDPVRTLAEMARVVRPGGRVVLQVPGPGYSLDVSYGSGWKSSRLEPKQLPGPEDPLGRFGVEELQDLVRSIGLEPEHTDVDNWHYEFATAEACLAFLGRTGADARVRGYAGAIDLLPAYGHLLDVGPLWLRGEFVTLTARKAAA